MSIVGRVEFSELTETKRKRSSATAKRHALDADGYSRKYPSDWMVKVPGRSKWYRVYICQVSNAATAYIDTQDGWIVVEGLP
jgi:hypothetical protein